VNPDPERSELAAGRWDRTGPVRPIRTFRRPNGAIGVELYLLPDTGE
jgi:hypothetical protein